MDLKIKKVNTPSKMKALRGRGVTRSFCDELGGSFAQLGNERVCFVEETKLKEGKVLKKVDVEVVDLGGEEIRDQTTKESIGY